MLVSLGPLLLAGYYMLALSSQVVKKTTLAGQQGLAAGLTETVSNYVSTYRNVLFDAARLDDLQSESASRQQAVLNHLMQMHASLLEISVTDPSGAEKVRVGRFVRNPVLRDLSGEDFFKTSIKNGEYIGGLERFMGQYPTVNVAVLMLGNNDGKNKGVLWAKLSLNGLSGVLKTGFPESSGAVAAVIAPDGFLIAHSDMEEVFRPDAGLPKEVLDVLLRNTDKKGGGEIVLADGTHVLSAFSEVDKLGWLVYLQQPTTAVDKASAEMVAQSTRAMIFVVIFVVFLSYLMSAIVVQPIQNLRDAAIKLGSGDFEDMPAVAAPDNEIGELAHAFNLMKESLRIKTAELTTARDELQALNRSLESRVEARTRELKSAQNELIAKERLAAIGQMASVVGHEIRNPLAVINNSAYFIKAKLAALGTTEPKIEKHLGIIESEIQQANGIISEILGFARTRDLILQKTFLQQYVEDILQSYPFPPHIELVRAFAPQDVTVNIDVEEMKQAVRNVLGNAIEVMPEAGKLTISTTHSDSGFVCLAIRDTGPGIPPEVFEKIFAPFFTTKSRGTGLGLAVLRKVMDRHKGRVEVETSPAGTVFKLYLPVCNA